MFFTYVIYVIYLTGFSTRPVCLAGGHAVSAVSRFEPHSYCHASRILHVVVVVVVVVDLPAAARGLSFVLRLAV